MNGKNCLMQNEEFEELEELEELEPLESVETVNEEVSEQTRPVSIIESDLGIYIEFEE